MFGLEEVDTLVTDDGARPRRSPRCGGAGRGRRGRIDAPRAGNGRDDRRHRPDRDPRGPAAIRATVARSAGPPARSPRRWRPAGVRRIHVIGNGTSYHSQPRRGARSTGGTPGRTTRSSSPVDRGGLRDLPARARHGDAIVGISSSGEFKDVVAAAERHRGAVPIGRDRPRPGLHADAGSPSDVAALGRRPVHGPGHDEDVLRHARGDGAAAASSCSATTAGDALGRALLAAADAADAAIAAAEPLVEPLASSLRDARHVFVTGGGLGHPAALEAALKLKEMALVHAEGAEAWEMTSGAATMLGPDAVVIALAPAGPGRGPRSASCSRHAADWGARTIEVGPERLGRRRPRSSRSPAAAAEDHAPLTAVPPVALLAVRARPCARRQPRPPRLDRAVPQPGAAAHPRRREEVRR